MIGLYSARVHAYSYWFYYTRFFVLGNEWTQLEFAFVNM